MQVTLNDLSTRFRDVISFSKEEAIRRGHDYVNPGHLLLGIIKEGEGTAIKILRNLNCEPQLLKEAIERAMSLLVSVHKTLSVDSIPFTTQAEIVLKFAFLESQLHRGRVAGTEHLLLGLLREKDATTSKILAERFSITYDAVVEEMNIIRTASKAQGSVQEGGELVLDTTSEDESIDSALRKTLKTEDHRFRAIILITEVRDSLARIERSLQDHAGIVSGEEVGYLGMKTANLVYITGAFNQSTP